MFRVLILKKKSLNVKKFYLTHRKNPVSWYQFGSGRIGLRRNLNESGLHSTKLQNKSLSIGLLSVLSRAPVRVGSYISSEIQSVYSSAQADWACIRVYAVFKGWPPQKKKNRNHIFLTEIQEFNSKLFFFKDMK